jgi:hypothetical protein
MVPGSQESIDFVQSIIDCKNGEIFSTPFINNIMTDKWRQVKTMMIIQASIYALYLIALMFFITDLEEELASPTWDLKIISFYSAFVLNLLLFANEAIAMTVSGTDYWKELLNYIDVARFILFMVCSYFVYFLQSDDKALPAVLIFVSWIRGIIYFRIFDSTRYLIHLVIQVIKDMVSFVFVTIYVIIGLAILLWSMRVTESQNITFLKSFAYTYLVSIGEYGSFGESVDTFSFISLAIFVLLSVVNTIIMMNLLISIISDTYDKVQLGIAEANLKQLGYMIIEIESLMYWKRGVEENKYMQKVFPRFGSDVNRIWQGKVKEIENTMTNSELNVISKVNQVKEEMLEEIRKMITK